MKGSRWRLKHHTRHPPLPVYLFHLGSLSFSRAFRDQRTRQGSFKKLQDPSVLRTNSIQRMASLLWSYGRIPVMLGSGLSVVLSGALYYFQKLVQAFLFRLRRLTSE